MIIQPTPRISVSMGAAQSAGAVWSRVKNTRYVKESRVRPQKYNPSMWNERKEECQEVLRYAVGLLALKP